MKTRNLFVLLLCSILATSLVAQDQSLAVTTSNPAAAEMSPFLKAKEAFNTKARAQLQLFLNAAEQQLNGETVDVESISALFVDAAAKKIRVTNHKKEGYELFPVADYFEHLTGLNKQYKTKSIQFTIEEGPIETGTLGNYWIAKLNFTQDFKGMGRSNYCDQTNKTVKLYIDKSDETYTVLLGDVWFNETTEMDCDQ